jgi:Flp pilus assembly protein TadG
MFSALKMASKTKLDKCLYFARSISRSLIGRQEGVAAIELALVSPVIIFLLVSTVDFSSYLMAHSKISRAAYSMSNLMTQMNEGMTEAQVSDLMLSLNEVSNPFDLANNGRAVVTAIIGVGDDGASPDSYEVAWQRCYGDNSLTLATSFGEAGSSVSTSVVPANTIVTSSQILVVTEIIYNFEPVMGYVGLDWQIEYSSYFRPRLGSIATIVDDGSTPATC